MGVELFGKEGADEQPEADRADGADEAGDHERMVEQVLADARRARSGRTASRR